MVLYAQEWALYANSSKTFQKEAISSNRIRFYFVMAEFGNTKYIAKYHVSSCPELEAKKIVSQGWVLVPALVLIS